MNLRYKIIVVILVITILGLYRSNFPHCYKSFKSSILNSVGIQRYTIIDNQDINKPLNVLKHFQAVILKQSLSNASGAEQIVNELNSVIATAQQSHKKGIKAQKVSIFILKIIYVKNSFSF